jgi:hypothetical protein
MSTLAAILGLLVSILYAHLALQYRALAKQAKKARLDNEAFLKVYKEVYGHDFGSEECKARFPTINFK